MFQKDYINYNINIEILYHIYLYRVRVCYSNSN